MHGPSRSQLRYTTNHTHTHTFVIENVNFIFMVSHKIGVSCRLASNWKRETNYIRSPATAVPSQFDFGEKLNRFSEIHMDFSFTRETDVRNRRYYKILLARFASK